MDVIPSDNNQRIAGSAPKEVQNQPSAKEALKRLKKEGLSIGQRDTIEMQPLTSKKEDVGISIKGSQIVLGSGFQQDQTLNQTKELILNQPNDALEAQTGGGGSAFLKTLFQ